MKVTLPIGQTGRVIEAEGATLADVFRDLGRASECFTETHCGVCGLDGIVPLYRVAGEYEFFEWACTAPDCGARLTMGVRKSKEHPGWLFPVRKLTAGGKPDWEHGTAGPHRGWTTYRGDTGADDGPRTPQPRRPAPPTSPAASKPATSAPSKPATSAPSPAPSPAPPRPHPDLPADPAEKITALQWAEIQIELRKHGIADRPFLVRFNYESPREICAAHFLEALDAARSPDEQLLSLQREWSGKTGAASAKR